METRLSKKRRMESSINLFDLPVEVLISLGKYLELEDIFNFRCYSRYSKELGNAMLSAVRTLNIMPRIFPRNQMQIRVIVQQCHRLRKIRLLLDGSKALFTDEAFENLLINNPCVEEIVLGNMSALPLKALTPIATCFKNLVKITFIGDLLCSEFMKIFNAHNNHLLEVEFNIVWQSNDVIMEIWEFLKNQPKLQRLSLPALYKFTDYGSYYDRILSTIAEVCKELTYIEIPWNIKAADLYIGLRKIADNCPKLRIMDFTHRTKISGKPLNYLKSKNIEVYGNYYYQMDFESNSSDESFISYEYHRHDDWENDDYDDGSYDSSD